VKIADSGERRSFIGGSDARIAADLNCGLRLLLPGRLTDTLAEPKAGAPAIFVDEFDARGFERTPNGEIICRRKGNRLFSDLGPADRIHTQS
jgi:hypothetical protein